MTVKLQSSMMGAQVMMVSLNILNYLSLGMGQI